MSTSSTLEPASPHAEPIAYRLAAGVINGAHRVVIVVGASAYVLNDFVDEEEVPAALPTILAEWQRWRPIAAAAAQRVMASPKAPAEVERWLAPVQPDKLLCIGTNYHDHLREMGTPNVPTVPYSFLKPAATGIVATNSKVSLPARSTMVDWEAELAVVIGHTPEPNDPDIMASISGYIVLNDLSARDWIIGKPEVGIDWVMMKGYDGFSPIGPYFTPSEFVANPQDLWIKCWVNGELKQDSNTSEMVFGVETILRHASGIMTLNSGDVIATGTPAGVGFGARPQQFLKHGDTVSVEIQGLGRLETHMVDLQEGANR
ncbi:fumarylacetoacetate hydrolase family protein [Salinibacterium sp. NK8237]|uniref:fumarylacetoacetate hydrolase family protein n=1 Tax=Salinibacterium sp. NK8237 TaxID=2792038 RepID=UPI0018CEFC56|nr:fumarylacetoacetate hydrolase family protein [Salinibacterium sp. NK8237]MBH0130099.1 fumarylacetoacetate hydrolase family protein [Salinibacterium sp. NK8237]